MQAPDVSPSSAESELERREPFRLRPILDPRDGDAEDDASSPKQKSLMAIAGGLLAEISLTQAARALRRRARERPCLALDLEAFVITGDMTDAGRSAEWAEFFDILKAHPGLAERTLVLPGNHDVNVLLEA